MRSRAEPALLASRAVPPGPLVAGPAWRRSHGRPPMRDRHTLPAGSVPGVRWPRAVGTRPDRRPVAPDDRPAGLERVDLHVPAADPAPAHLTAAGTPHRT